MQKWVRCRINLRVFVVASALGFAGCENALAPYKGPRPSTNGMVSEVAIVRYVEMPVLDQHSFIVDRTRFVDSGNPHDVDRVVWVFTNEATVAQVRALELQVGDTIVISTRYSGVREVGELTNIPNWPGHRYYEYPIGAHILTAVARVP